MAYTKKEIGPDSFVYVKSVFGKGPEAKERYNFIPNGGMNEMIKTWQDKQADRELTIATPSSILTCPRVLWYQKRGVPFLNEMTWAVKQRLLLGRLFENQFATILEDEGALLYHWKDDPGVEVEKFYMGEGESEMCGVPDYLVKLKDGTIAVSDAKTSRSDNFGYVPIEEDEVWKEWGWYKNKLQLTAYYMLCHNNSQWFSENGLQLPTHCHLFSYALDDGLVRREYTWIPTDEDINTVFEMKKRFNRAIQSETIPECTCAESNDRFDVKFCRYGIVEEGKKIAEKCCDPELQNKVKE